MSRRQAKSTGRPAPSGLAFIFSLRTAIFILLLAIVWILYHVPELNHYLVVRDQRDAQRNKVEALEREISSLNTKLQRGPYEDERALRERYKMVKPGERMIQIEVEDIDESADQEVSLAP